MGLTNVIAIKYGVPAALEVIKEKDEALYELIECLDEKSFPEALAVFLKKTMEIQATNAGKPKLPKKHINWMKYSERLMTEKPALKVILDLFAEFGLVEISGIKVADLLDALTSQNDK